MNAKACQYQITTEQGESISAPSSHIHRTNTINKGSPVRKRGVNRYDIIRVQWKGMVGLPYRTYVREELWIVPHSRKPYVCSALPPAEQVKIKEKHKAIRVSASVKVAENATLSEAIMLREIVLKMVT